VQRRPKRSVPESLPAKAVGCDLLSRPARSLQLQSVPASKTVTGNFRRNEVMLERNPWQEERLFLGAPPLHFAHPNTALSVGYRSPCCCGREVTLRQGTPFVNRKRGRRFGFAASSPGHKRSSIKTPPPRHLTSASPPPRIGPGQTMHEYQKEHRRFLTKNPGGRIGSPAQARNSLQFTQSPASIL